jgi:hypothetical protein
VPDLALREEARRRREAIFLDLPEAIAIIGLALRAGQSLRQAFELAARDCARHALSTGNSLRNDEGRDRGSLSMVRLARCSSGLRSLGFPARERCAEAGELLGSSCERRSCGL